MNTTLQNLRSIQKALLNGNEVNEEILKYYGLIEEEKEEKIIDINIHGLNGNPNQYKLCHRRISPAKLTKNRFRKGKGTFETMYKVARKTDIPYNIQLRPRIIPKSECKQMKFTPNQDKVA